MKPDFSNPFMKCLDCDMQIKTGIINVIDHYKEYHKLGEFTDSLIKLRTEKGTPLTEQELKLKQ